MKDKYVIVDVSCDEAYFVELTPSQLKAMQWLVDKMCGEIAFCKISSEQEFEEI